MGAALHIRAGDVVVCVAAHPDDEAFCHGGLLARAAAAGARVAVIALTRGEGGKPRSDAPRREQAPVSKRERPLAVRREEELRAACSAVGAAPPRFLGAVDGAVDDREPALRRALDAALAALSPTLLLCGGPDGAYGHRDHLACWRLCEAAWRSLPQRPPRLLQAAFPRGLFAPLWRRLRRFAFVDPSLGVADLGVEAASVDHALTLDEGERRCKAAMLACHESQLLGGDPQTFLLPEIARWVLTHEWYLEARR